MIGHQLSAGCFHETEEDPTKLQSCSIVVAEDCDVALAGFES